MPTEIFWIDGQWPGRIGMAARPRGGDWLDLDLAAWRKSGVDTVLSLLTADEERDLNLTEENAAAQIHGMRFLSLPIPDRQTPASQVAVASALKEVDADLSRGKSVLVHCRQGVGRSGVIAACLLSAHGIDPQTAIERISSARGVAVPETSEQRVWIDNFAECYHSSFSAN